MSHLCPTAAAPSQRVGLRHAESRTTASRAGDLIAWLLLVSQLAHGLCPPKKLVKVTLNGPA